MTWLGWVRRHLVSRPARTAVSLVAVTIGVAVYVGVASGTRAVITAIRSTGGAGIDPDSVEFFESIERSLAPLAGAALMVSGFIIYLTTTRTVGDRQVTFGTMRAIGARRGTVLGVVLAEAFVIGVVGTAAGLALGRLLGPLVGDTMAGTFGITVGSSGGASLTTRQAVVAVVGGLLVPPIAAGLPAWRAARVEPATAMRHVADDASVPWRRGAVGVVAFVAGTVWSFAAAGEAKSTGVLLAMVGLLAGVPLLVAPCAAAVRRAVLRSRPGLGDVAAAQLARRKGRTAVTAGLVTGTLTLVILVQTVVASQRPAFVGAVETTLGADAELSLPSTGTEMLDSVRSSPGVAAATPVSRQRAEVGADRTSTENVTVIDPATYFDVAGFTWTRGTDGDAAVAALRATGSVLVSTNIADATGLDTGDTLTVSTEVGEERFRVAGTYYGFAYGTSDAVVMTAEDARGLFPGEWGSVVLVDLHGGAAAVGNSAASGLPPGSYVFPTAMARADIIGQFDGIFGLVQVIAVLVALLGLVGMGNTLAMEILDRRHEFGVLRALGLQRRAVVRWVVLEGALLAGVAVSLAVVAGTALGWALADSGAGGIDELEISRHIPMVPVSVFALLAVAAGALASVLPGRSAARDSPTELLRAAD